MIVWKPIWRNREDRKVDTVEEELRNGYNGRVEKVVRYVCFRVPARLGNDSGFLLQKITIL